MSSNIKNNNTELWDRNRRIIRSSIGGWKVGEAVYNHGYSMMDDFVGKLSYMQVVILNATGRLPERKIADWVEQVHICMSWPDSRIWCNQIGALAGTNRASVIAATSAGLLANDSRSYGTKTIVEGVEFIQSAMSQYKSGLSADEIVKNECAKHGGKPHIMGYARPIAKGDERISAMEAVQNTLDISLGDHQKLAYKINDILSRDFDATINFNGYLSAVLTDNDFTPRELYRLLAILVSSGITACYVDCMDKPAESFFTQRCNDIEYIGKPIRNLPE